MLSAVFSASLLHAQQADFEKEQRRLDKVKRTTTISKALQVSWKKSSSMISTDMVVS